MKLSKYIWNILYTDPGIMQGFTIRYFQVYLFIFRSMLTFKFPIWIVGYNKKQAIEIRKIQRKLERHLAENEWD